MTGEEASGPARDILAARAEPLSTAAVAVAALAARVDAAAAAAGQELFAQWSGVGAQTAQRRHTELVVAARDLARALTDLAGALAVGAQAVTTAQHRALRAQALARAAGLPTGGGMAPIELDPQRELAAQAAAAMLRSAQRDYAAAGLALAGALRRCAPSPAVPLRPASRGGPPDPWPVPADPPGPGLDGLAVASPPPAGPAAAIWFAALTPAAREWAITARPEWVGPADGLPAWARDRANRLLLDAAQEQLRDRARTEPGDPDAAAGLAAIAALRALLTRDDGRMRQLLALDVTGRRVTAAVTTGDLDSAAGVAVFVPGFTTSVATHLAGYAARLESLADLATRQAGEPVVGIVWQDYQAPQVSEVLDPARSVAGLGPARAGALRLRALLAGLADLPGLDGRVGPGAAGAGRSRVVVIGHSYGSTVAGLALATGGRADAFVAAGSPGLGVRDVRALAVPPGRTYAVESPSDPVADAGWFGTDPDRLAGVGLLATRAAALPDGSSGATASGHEGYLKPGTTSAWNLAAVAAGRTDLLVTTAQCDRPSAFLPWPPGCAPMRRAG